MDHATHIPFTHPAKWRETVDPFTLGYCAFSPTTILGYPHAGNDVFHAEGTFERAPLRAYIKSVRQKGADLRYDVEILSQLRDPIFPKVLDYDREGYTFSVTAELPGTRLSVIVGENKDLQSLSYMEEYGETLSRLHAMEPIAPVQKDRKFYHTPSPELLAQLELSHLEPYFANKPTEGKKVFCHGDLHYANILWKDHHISGILDFELSGYGDRDFDIAWSMFLRPGQKFFQTVQEEEAFLRGYQKHNPCNPTAVTYYMARCYVYFLNSFQSDTPYATYIRTWLNSHCT